MSSPCTHSAPINSTGIDNITLIPEGDICFLESFALRYLSHPSPKDFHAEFSNTHPSLLPTFSIPEEVDSLREEIDIFPGPDDSIPPGIKSDDFDSEDDNNSTSLPEFDSFHVDYPDSGDSTINVVEDIPVDICDPGICIEVESTRILAPLSPVIDTLLPFSSENEDKVFNQESSLLYKEKSPPSSSHRGLKAFQLSPESPMMIHGDNTPNLGFPGFLKPLLLAVFVLRSQELHILSFILGIRYPNLID
ncbi:hypothetical protein Tco_0437733 [Tanacetum coccineum]